MYGFFRFILLGCFARFVKFIAAEVMCRECNMVGRLWSYKMQAASNSAICFNQHHWHVVKIDQSALLFTKQTVGGLWNRNRPFFPPPPPPPPTSVSWSVLLSRTFRLHLYRNGAEIKKLTWDNGIRVLLFLAHDYFQTGILWCNMLLFCMFSFPYIVKWYNFSGMTIINFYNE